MNIKEPVNFIKQRAFETNIKLLVAEWFITEYAPEIILYLLFTGGQTKSLDRFKIKPKPVIYIIP